MKCKFAGWYIIIACLASCRDVSRQPDYSGWRTYAGSKDGIRYADNDQVNTGNVAERPAVDQGIVMWHLLYQEVVNRCFCKSGVGFHFCNFLQIWNL